MLFTLGCDPEGFLVNAKGVPVSSIGKIGGSKEFPLPIPGGYVQEDNVMVEFNTTPVACNSEDVSISRKEWKDSVWSVKRQLDNIAKQLDLSVLYKSVVDFPEHELLHPQALASGCDPDYNVYTRARNEYPALHKTLRGAGGHLHIGIENLHDHPTSLTLLVKNLDLLVGVTLKYIEGETPRDATYGRFGNFRPKKYGVEYRTPSGWWVHSINTVQLVHKLVHAAVGRYERGYNMDYSLRGLLTEKEHLVQLLSEYISGTEIKNILKLKEEYSVHQK